MNLGANPSPSSILQPVVAEDVRVSKGVPNTATASESFSNPRHWRVTLGPLAIAPPVHPRLITRTWADVMDAICERGKDSPRMRHSRAMRRLPYEGELFNRALADLRGDEHRQIAGALAVVMACTY